jgi:hypothetical protein
VHAQWLERYRRLLALRRNHVVPLLPRLAGGAYYRLHGSNAIEATWPMQGGVCLAMLANLGAQPQSGLPRIQGTPFYTSHDALAAGLSRGVLAPWSVAWLIGNAAQGIVA